YEPPASPNQTTSLPAGLNVGFAFRRPEDEIFTRERVSRSRTKTSRCSSCGYVQYASFLPSGERLGPQAPSSTVRRRGASSGRSFGPSLTPQIDHLSR